MMEGTFARNRQSSVVTLLIDEVNVYNFSGDRESHDTNRTSCKGQQLMELSPQKIKEGGTRILLASKNVNNLLLFSPHYICVKQKEEGRSFTIYTAHLMQFAPVYEGQYTLLLF